ncbi:hypothetical protein TSAR_014940 [Trichomalopsis sarcophagae]|uniref:Uncharacterized protein n=1 Tax=Trichomalopsis sarcophagae TaxID=543379 RepID=A0A232FLY4_9HYME|nr:hypothetical protein TSAR_014940 [Trichomalopsis sarcophagae]
MEEDTFAGLSRRLHVIFQSDRIFTFLRVCRTDQECSEKLMERQ